MEKFISKEMEIMELEENIHVIREDLTGDALASAKLVKAALDRNWDEVEKLLAAGADPRICRWGSAFGVESALYYALRDKRFDMAEKLYKAGDRLDDLIIENDENLHSDVLLFLNAAMRFGDNYFYDASKGLSECCRCSNFAQIEKLLPGASQEELNKSIVPAVRSYFRNFKEHRIYSSLLEDLIARGAKISEEDRKELLESVECRFGSGCPAVLHPGKEAVEKLVSLIKTRCSR